jgi:hypothetical protein
MRRRVFSLLTLALILAAAQVILLGAFVPQQAATASLGDICMQNASIRRTNGFINALNAYYKQTLNALTVRRDEEVAAFDAGQPTSLEDATTAFNEAYDQAVRQFYQSNQNVWQIYRSDSQRCQSE